MKVLLFGGTGNLGKEIAKELKAQGYDVTAVVRDKNKAAELLQLNINCSVADVSTADSLTNIFAGFDAVVSALGKSVSPNDKSKATFRQIDLEANSAVLNEAIKHGIKKFVYVSAFHAEKYVHLEYFKVHHEFAEKLKQSGIDYSIIKPPAIFCAFKDAIGMAKKGQLINIGNGDKKTNPIFEGDLAKICVDSFKQRNATIEAGGKEIYTRKQLNEIIMKEVSPSKKLMSVPSSLFKMMLPIIKLFDKNSYEKFAFFFAVMQHDTIAPQLGSVKFEDYIRTQVNRDKTNR